MGHSTDTFVEGRYRCYLSAYDTRSFNCTPCLSVVFARFSSDSLRDRILDAESRVFITSDKGKRGGKLIGTKNIVDDALKQYPDVAHCLVYK